MCRLIFLNCIIILEVTDRDTGVPMGGKGNKSKNSIFDNKYLVILSNYQIIIETIIFYNI